ncbi:uncharacterized protein F5891DRAFT_1194938 [Suillus fuscotomentosus]|uniref:DUF6532 domain-containing protein n=1 Tax=Suillus fuscotomentosus TaxID=1912939 RepID=A0AAD4DY54_9AGAM|nr:uncharacterized protein F5891DRAFT_1194938 [Suillus fuscotomentosus]KAG1894783.1 hypothetical protein F5891DRAFT_1194938 [Suillus fuscotomentosus]
MSDIRKAPYSSGTTYARQATDEDDIEDRDFERDRDSDLEHDRDIGLERNNGDEFEGSGENDNQDPDDNFMDHEDDQTNRDQFQSQQEDDTDDFDDGFNGGMQADFDQGIDDEPDDAAQQESQEGKEWTAHLDVPLLLECSADTHPRITHIYLPLAQGLLIVTQDLHLIAQDLHLVALDLHLVALDLHLVAQDLLLGTQDLHAHSPRRPPSQPSQPSNCIQSLSKDTSPSDHTTSPTLHSRSFSITPEPDSRSSKKARKIKPIQGDPMKLGFYPPSWQALLQAAKVEMCLQAVLTHPVPELGDALQLAQEVLDAELWRYHEKKIKMDKGYFPEYKAQMSRVLCDDLFTFRTELKKVIIPIAKSAYNIFPKGTVTRKEDIQKHVITAATKLLKTGGYLHVPDLSNGKWKNFVSQALMDGCLAFYYSNSKKALKNTDEFHCTIPPNALILMAAVMKGVISGFSETGTDKVPDLSAEKCRTNFNSLQKSLDKLMDIPERRDELEDMLALWAGIGMGKLVHGDSSAEGSDSEDINIIL